MHLFLLVTVFLFAYASNRDPGYLEGLPIEEFAKTISRAIDESRNIQYFCFSCRGLMASTMTHCSICERCVESFDHHCKVIDNCVGQKNHCTFLGFIATAFVFTLIQIWASLYMLWIMVNCEWLVPSSLHSGGTPTDEMCNDLANMGGVRVL